MNLSLSTRPIIVFLVLLIASSNVFAANCDGENKSLHDGEFEVQIVEYFQTSNKANNVVLIIPPTGGVNFIDKSYAEEMCESGINATIISRWTDDDEYSIDLEIHKRFYSRAQQSIESTIKNYHGFKIGILGTSVGGIHAAIATSRFDEITSSFIIVGGGNIPQITATTEQDVMVEAREKRFKIHGYKSIKEYEKALQQVIPFEPLKLKYNSEQKKSAMVISLKDKVVPTKSQMDLKNYWNPKLVIESRFGHIFTVVKTWLFDSDKIIAFFK